MKLRKLSAAAIFAVIFALIIKSNSTIFVALAYFGTFLILVVVLLYNTQTHDR